MHVPVRVLPESYLLEIEQEIKEFTGLKMKVEEIIFSEIVCPKIKSSVLEILGLPSNLNLAYAILPHAHVDELIAVPTTCEDLEIDLM